MTHTAKVALTQACIFNSIAKQCFEAAAAEMIGTGKKGMNINVTRCKVNQSDVEAAITDEAARAHFRKEIASADTLQLGNMVELYLRMTPEERDVVENLIECIKSGELIEFTTKQEAA